MTRLLRVEGGFLALAALAAYQLSGGSWWLFLALILVPDISMLGYVGGPRVGAWSYNCAHSWIAPVMIYLVGHLLEVQLVEQMALILAAHIGIDRALGYGLKCTSSFKDTHLGRIGG